MTIWQLTAEDVEAVVTQLKSGRTPREVAEDLGISVEMVTCAVRKWPTVQRQFNPWAML
ncbi:MAG: hypothetical protein ACOY93_05335 [Bacillota bacterium]